MIQTRLCLASVSLMCWLVGVLAVSTACGQDLTGVKCVVNGKKAAKVESSVDYKGGKVYFCCDQCAEAFRKDAKLKSKAQHTRKANHQLVLTGQFVQTGCPMSGKKCDAGLMTDVGGVQIGFCNAGCMNQVKNSADLAAKSEFVFTDAAFKRAFQKKTKPANLAGLKCILEPKEDVGREYAAEYRDGQVFFCCDDCVTKFEKDNEPYRTAANRQLAQSGQYVQQACPISGGKVDEDQSLVLSGVTLKFCCEHCKAKVVQATSDSAKAELVFGSKGFDKSFARK